MSADATSASSIRSSVKWNAVALAGRQVVRAVSALVVAGLVGRDNFGIGGLAVIYVGLVVVFVRFGIDSSLVQRETLSDEHIGAATRISVLGGIAFAIATIVVAPTLADFYNTPELTDVLRVTSVVVLARAFASVPTALLMRDMRFAPLARAEVAGAVIGAAIGLTSAAIDRSYWAVVHQLVATELIILFGILISERTFKWRTSRKATKDVLTFGTSLVGTGVVNYAASNGDNIMVGAELGTAALGDYSLAYRVLSLPLQVVGQTVARTMLPTYSRLQHDRRAIASLHYRAARAMAAMVAGPLAFAALGAEIAVAATLGDEWLTAVPALRWICGAAFLRIVFGQSGLIMIAVNQPGWHFKWSFGTTIVTLLGFWVGLGWGTAGVAASTVITGIPVLIAGIWIAGREVPITVLGMIDVVRQSALATAVAIGIWFALGPITSGFNAFVDLGIRGAVLMVGYVGILTLSGSLRHDVARLVKERRT